MIAWLAIAHAGETPLLPRGATWRYRDDGVDPGAGWTDPAFDDSGWSVGPAPLGYGLPLLGTTVDYGPDPLRRYPTTWLRTTFDVADPTAFEALSLHLRRDDGAAVYVNGVEVLRTNLSATATATSYATVAVSGVDQDAFLPAVLPPGVVVAGTNTVAVELHNQSGSSFDLVMDLAVSGWDGPTAVVRGPWLQQTGPDGAIVRWNTDGPGAGRVWYGAAPGALGSVVDDPRIAFAHEARITGAPPDTRVAYAVGHATAGVLAGDDADHVFRTAPVPGRRAPFLAWVLGDSGTANADAEAVRDAWRGLHPNPLDTDVWLMLGDNAYGTGKDSEYQTAVFDFYPEWLRQVSLWATLGNHDGYSASSATQSGPYFDVFTFPTAGEVGGVGSGTEAYWSFDHANVHFVNLDSTDSDRSPTGAMATWLSADLAASTADWNVVFFHHPPYSKGSHDSDRELELVEMREFLGPILESYGVDLVLSGHSHSYERSWLLDGHYDTSDTFVPDVHVVQDRSGDPVLDGPYRKWQVGTAPHDGTVYVVAGSSGQRSGGPLDHPAMLVSLDELGSMSLAFDGLVLRAAFVDDLGAERDVFEIHKGVPTITDLSGETIGRENEVLAFSVTAIGPDGRPITDVAWDWGDGTRSQGATPTHAWAREGTFDVVVTATDRAGATDEARLQVGIDNGLPTITSATWSGVSLEGEPITFVAVASDPGGDPLTYEWTVDGEVLYGSTATHVFHPDGDYPVHLSVRDDAGREVTRDLAVGIANAAPRLDAFDAGSPVEGSPTTLLAFPADPGFDAVTVAWDLPGRSAVGPVVVHTFPDDGRVPVELTLTDADGAVTEVRRTVRVENAPPTVAIVGGAGPGAQEGEPIAFEAVAADPGASDEVGVTWTFGDGTRGRGRVVTHVFPDQGPYPVTARADDGEGGVGEATTTVTLADAPPEVVALHLPVDVVEGVPARLAVEVADPGVADELTVAWDLGGAVVAGAVVRYAFPDDGVVDGVVEVVDDEGAGTSAPFTLRVANAAPTFASAPPSRIPPGERLGWRPEVVDVDPVALTLVEGPPGAALVDGQVGWDAPDTPGLRAVFRLRADDGDGGVAEQAFEVVVADRSAAPPHRLDRGPAAPGGCDTAPAGPGAAVVLVALLGLRRATSR